MELHKMLVMATEYDYLLVCQVVAQKSISTESESPDLMPIQRLYDDFRILKVRIIALACKLKRGCITMCFRTSIAALSSNPDPESADR